jgi:Zn-finger nucleic acid-binding protein
LFSRSAFDRVVPAYPQQGGGALKCPSCDVDLAMSDRQGVEIDYCPKCRGVWLDRGELDKILERSGVAARTAEPHDRSTHDRPTKSEHEHRPRKRESWLGDIFDF